MCRSCFSSSSSNRSVNLAERWAISVHNIILLVPWHWLKWQQSHFQQTHKSKIRSYQQKIMTTLSFTIFLHKTRPWGLHLPKPWIWTSHHQGRWKSHRLWSAAATRHGPHQLWCCPCRLGRLGRDGTLQRRRTREQLRRSAGTTSLAFWRLLMSGMTLGW